MQHLAFLLIRLVNTSSGEIVHEQVVGNSYETIDISAFTKGVYILLIDNNGYQMNQRLIINSTLTNNAF